MTIKKCLFIFSLAISLNIFTACEKSMNVTPYLPNEFYQDLSEDIKNQKENGNNSYTYKDKENELKIKMDLNPRETIDEVFLSLKSGKYEYANLYLISDNYTSKNGIIIKENVFTNGKIDDETRSLLNQFYNNLEYNIENIDDSNKQNSYAVIKITSKQKSFKETITLKKVNGQWKILINDSFINIITLPFFDLSSILDIVK